MSEYRSAIAEDASALAEISRRAFDSDIEHGRSEIGGPPGYDSPDWQREMMAQSTEYLCILDGRQLIGGMIVFAEGTRYRLGRIFIDPEYQGRGVGRQAVSHLFERFPWASLWSLSTPSWNRRTRAFYTALGFVLEKEEGGFLYFRKEITPPEGLENNRDSLENPEILFQLVDTEMPFGKHAGRRIADIPEDYLLWFEQKGFPKGKLGQLMALMLEMRKNGLEKLLDPLR